MEGNGSGNDDNGDQVGIAGSRSRRERNVRSRGRKSALEAFKNNRASGRTRNDDDDEIENVYEMVDENEYSEMVAKRINDDWLVGGADNGLEEEYYEDGREVFDEDVEDTGKAGNKKKAGGGANKSKAKSSDNKVNSTSGEDTVTSMQGRSIKNMLANMPSKKKVDKKAGVGLSGANGGGASSDLKEDEILGELLGKIKSTNKAATGKAAPPTLKPIKAAAAANGGFGGASGAGPLVTRKATGIKRPLEEVTTATQNIEEYSQPEVKVKVEEEDDFADDDVIMAAMDDDQMIDDFPTQEVEVKQEVKQEVKEEPEIKQEQKHRGFVEQAKAKAKEAPSFSSSFPKRENSAGKSASSEMYAATTDALSLDGQLPLTTNEQGEKVLRMYWLDAHEDPFKHPGTVWLFGKVYVEKAKAFVSCCLTVKNVERNVFLLKREHKWDVKAGKPLLDDEEDGEPIPATIGDVYQEFNSKIAVRYKIPEFKSKPSRMSYAFQLEDVPDVADYLEILYEPKYQALPSDLKGETFSRIFAANQSSLERFLLSRKIKGPSWIDVKMATPSSPASSWCKVEAVCLNPASVSVVSAVSNLPPPPLTVLTLNLKTVINAKTLQNEIAIASGLFHPNFYLDKPAPKPNFTSHFCAMTRPSDEIWPFDLQKVMASGQHSKVDKMDSERALLAFLLAKVGKLDPDIIIGHDISSFDLDVILHRAVVNKIPNWSRLGRLKRTVPPFSSKGGGGGRLIDRQAVTGRLVCDLKVSAKELIRCKSYDLPSLAEKLLAKSAEDRLQIDCDVMRSAYSNSNHLLQCANVSLMDASDTLQCICELNALPLALQITKVAGNVMSRTLLGGRAERNEYLLLHAFTEKGYLVPDKQYGGKANKAAAANDEEEGGQGAEKAKAGGGRKKPAYAGGLVLEPKKGFYDKFILLMDFNSLYPSIIQEYNICFTTVNRKRKSEAGEKDDDGIPDLPSNDLEAGVLPTEIRKLVESRKSVKKLLKEPGLSHDQRMQYDIRQKALKLTANSMYGCLGFSFSRFFAKPLAALVTSKGREILLQTKELVEKMNLEVIYGDTDSIMINSNSRNYEEVFKLGAQIKQTVNKLYKLLELDIDGVFKYMLLLKKKKYAAVTMEKLEKTGEIVEAQELKGLDIVRRDWCQLAANAGKSILGFILSDLGPDERLSRIHEKLEALASDLKAGQVALNDLGITKQLTKDPEDYPDKKSLAHVQVALRMNSKGGKKIRAGDTVPYVICQDGSSLAATQRAYHIDEVRDEKSGLSVDINYYLAQQLHPVVSRLCEPLEGTDSARIAQCLGLDPEQYRRSVRVTVTADDQNMQRNEEKFRQCQKLTIECLCGESMTLDTAVRGRGREATLALAKCSSLDCKRIPILERSAYISNKLTLEVRSHVQRYYAGWIICEDPGCSGRTRQMPLVFQRAFPVCPTCSKATMYTEYSDSQLYLQLLYYQHLFEVQKALDRSSGEEREALSRGLKVEAAAADGGQTTSVLQKYTAVKNQLDKLMKENKFSIVSLNKVFEGLQCVKASRFKSTAANYHNNESSSTTVSTTA